MSRLLKMYLTALNRNPLITQALSTGFLMATGDAISQFAIEKKSVKEFVPERTVRFFTFGTCLLGPSLRGWYSLLDKVVKRPAPVGVVAKIALDQLLFSPVVLVVFLGTMTLWTTFSVDETLAVFKKEYTSILLANYALWPAAQSINFYFIPLQHRVLFANGIALLWNTYLAYKAQASTTDSITVDNSNKNW